MKLVNRDGLEDYLDFNEIYSKTKDGFIKFSKGQTITPPFTIFEIPHNNGSVHLKYGYVIGADTFSLKYSGAFYENEKIGLSNFLGLFVVFNANTGEAELVIDDKGFLTDYRTGIAGAIATKTLARENSEVVTVIGTGIQARMQINALLKVMTGIKVLNVYGRNINNMEKYCDEMKEKHPELLINMFDNPKNAIKEADIIYTVTYSEKYILESEWIKSGTHITAIGACAPNMQELQEELLKKADILAVDSREACSTHGEVHHGIEKGLIKLEDTIELGNLIEKGIKRADKGITICDLVGIGFQDAVIGDCVYRGYHKKATLIDENHCLFM